MRKVVLTLAMLFVLAPQAVACVGKILTIGVVDTADGHILAELLSALINERTGTTVEVRYYDRANDLYEEVKTKLVDISVENTSRALRELKKPLESDPDRAYEVAKTAYEKEKGLIWLKPFRFLNGVKGEGPSYTATVLRIDIINNFPALPRVIGKLGPAIDDATYAKLIRSVESGRAPKAVARDFLKSKKLI